MENLILEKENIIEDTINLFRLKKELNYIAIEDIRNLFSLEKEPNSIKDRIIRDITNLFGHEKKDYYKPVRVNNFWNNNQLFH